MDIRVVEDTITFKELQKVAEEFYRSMVKGAIDIKREIVAFGGEYHIDAANKLAEIGSNTGDTWGFNIRLDKPRDSWIEYTAMINIKPKVGNRNMLPVI
ncbi:hypothetical protein A3A41_04445 [Candidatus Kaiserbacteria bacterium RIFCSPLOWO2_01_FULL_54_22]|nr:MAG: hypothetical protein A3A41_04445 [Candidatus Kaiserbacteria bacterium RIFCSPLOWO2_01_FULL_54_22]